jgi:protocatechuate 3,4-dioxygenase beta subunit
MQDLNEHTVTEAVLQQMANTTDPRLKEIMESAVRHLHAFAREVSLTPAEWLTAIKFLTEVGQACTAYRQEFILLSDVIGLSALVNALHDKSAPDKGTTSSLLGPFYRQDAPTFELGQSIATSGDSGPELVLYGRVTDTSGKPIPNASVQVWQTDAQGLYDLQTDDPSNMDLRGCFRCDAEGRYHFRTVRPLGYSIPLDGPVGELIRAQKRHGCRPGHIHFLIGAEGYRELVTALYLAEDQYVDTDTVFGVSRSLVISPQEKNPESPVPDVPSARFDFSLGRAAAADGEGRVGADPSQIIAAAQ